jgi:hypothetical protein
LRETSCAGFLTFCDACISCASFSGRDAVFGHGDFFDLVLTQLLIRDTRAPLSDMSAHRSELQFARRIRASACAAISWIDTQRIECAVDRLLTRESDLQKSFAIEM